MILLNKKREDGSVSYLKCSCSMYEAVEFFNYNIKGWPISLSSRSGLDRLIDELEKRAYNASAWAIKDEYKNHILNELRIIKRIVDSDKSILANRIK